MKAISLKVSGIPVISGRRVLNFLSANALWVGIAGAAAAYAGCMFSLEIVMYAGAAVALASLRPSEKKGDEA